MAAVSSTLLEQFHEELSCSICRELFTRPKVLPCQHTFCEDCLQNHAEGETTIQCPLCRQQLELPSQGVSGLPDNHLVTSLCERLQNQATLSGETTEQPRCENRCSFHPSEEVRLYCKQCNMPVCNECLDDAHSKHNTISLKRASQERKAPIQDLIAEGRNMLEKYCSFLRGLRKKEKALNKEKLQTVESITYAYSQMVKKLTERKDYLVCKADNHHWTQIKVLRQERNKVLADVNELSAACVQAEQEMERGGLTFLSSGTTLSEVVGKCRGKAASLTPIPTLPAVFHSKDTRVPPLGHVMIPIVFGGEGSKTGQFDKPNGVTVSKEGEIFVVDWGNKRIQVFNLQGTFVRQFPKTSFHEREFGSYDVAIDRKGNLWVVGNAGSDSLAVNYTKQGTVKTLFELQKTRWIRGVAVDTRRNHILITQTTGKEGNTHGIVQVFTPEGRQVGTVGKKQGMKQPLYIAVDGEWRILVSDCGNSCVFIYDEDGQFLFKFGLNLSNPFGICSNKAGNFIVADSGNRCVKEMQESETDEPLKIKPITTDMFVPRAVAMAPDGQLVVTDITSHTILIMPI